MLGATGGGRPVASNHPFEHLLSQVRAMVCSDRLCGFISEVADPSQALIRFFDFRPKPALFRGDAVAQNRRENGGFGFPMEERMSSRADVCHNLLSRNALCKC